MAKDINRESGSTIDDVVMSVSEKAAATAAAMPVTAPRGAVVTDDDEDLTQFSVRQLRPYAKEIGVLNVNNMSKVALIDAITAARKGEYVPKGQQRKQTKPKSVDFSDLDASETLDGFNVPTLRAYARHIGGISNISNLNRNQLVTAILGTRQQEQPVMDEPAPIVDEPTPVVDEPAPIVPQEGMTTEVHDEPESETEIPSNSIPEAVDDVIDDDPYDPFYVPSASVEPVDDIVSDDIEVPEEAIEPADDMADMYDEAPEPMEDDIIVEADSDPAVETPLDGISPETTSTTDIQGDQDGDAPVTYETPVTSAESFWGTIDSGITDDLDEPDDSYAEPVPNETRNAVPASRVPEIIFAPGVLDGTASYDAPHGSEGEPSPADTLQETGDAYAVAVAEAEAVINKDIDGSGEHPVIDEMEERLAEIKGASIPSYGDELPYGSHFATSEVDQMVDDTRIIGNAPDVKVGTDDFVEPISQETEPGVHMEGITFAEMMGYDKVIEPDAGAVPQGDATPATVAPESDIIGIVDNDEVSAEVAQAVAEEAYATGIPAYQNPSITEQPIEMTEPVDDGNVPETVDNPVDEGYDEGEGRIPMHGDTEVDRQKMRGSYTKTLIFLVFLLLVAIGSALWLASNAGIINLPFLPTA